MWIIVCSTMNARGTAKIASDYLLFFQELGFEAKIISPRLSDSRLYGLLWELAALYMLRISRQSRLVLVNGRVSPLLQKRRCDLLLVTLDMMNFGWKAFWTPATSVRERINIAINTLFVPGSQGKARWRSAISKKTQLDLVELDYSKGVRLRKPGIVYPSGSFTGTNEGDWQTCAKDKKEELEAKKDIARAMWITGETRNKGFIKASEMLRSLGSVGTRMQIEILGIRSERLRVHYEGLMEVTGGISSLFRTKVSERELIELYVSSNVALCLSEEEGFGLPFMDAILFGLPVVAKKIDTYIEICELVKEEGIGLPPILWIKNTRIEVRRGVTRGVESDDREWLLEARDFIKIQAGAVGRDIREERKRKYRESASLLIKRSSRDLAKLIAS